MTACYYLQTSGLNDTISFQADSGSMNLVGMNIEVVDIQHKISIEKNPKKRRLMKERQFTVHAGKAILTKMMEGAIPELEKQDYDAQGNEKQVRRKKTVTMPSTAPGEEQQTVEVDEEPEVEQSFFQKYWWHMLVGFVLIQSLTGGGDDEQPKTGGGRPSKK